MIDAKRNNVTASREVVLDHTGQSWIDTHERDASGDRLYTNGDSLGGEWLSLTKAEIKQLEILESQVDAHLGLLDLPTSESVS